MIHFLTTVKTKIPCTMGTRGTARASYTHTHTHTHQHARTHARAHTHTHRIYFLFLNLPYQGSNPGLESNWRKTGVKGRDFFNISNECILSIIPVFYL